VGPISHSESFGAGLLYACNGGTAAFPIELLETPPSSQLNPDPALALIGWPAPTTATSWWLIARTETRAEYLGREPDGRSYELAILEREGEGTWNAVGWGGCGFNAVVPNSENGDALGWWIRPRDWPQPDDRRLHIRVRTWCPATLPDRMLDPVVRYGSDRIMVIVAARPLPQDLSACGEDQVADATIRLDEPVGDRMVLDGSRWPGRDAHVKTEDMALCCG
jgi:hypothetical protein